MNIPKAIEQAFASTIRQYAEIGEGVTIRAWQSLADDDTWTGDTERSFPMIDVRCSPPATDENHITLQVECAILLATNADDDADHAFVSAMYDAVQELCDTMYAAFRAGGTPEGAYKNFLDTIDERTTSGQFAFGGFTYGVGFAPSDEGGVNMVGINMTVHYSRTDF